MPPTKASSFHGLFTGCKIPVNVPTACSVVMEKVMSMNPGFGIEVDPEARRLGSVVPPHLREEIDPADGDCCPLCGKSHRLEFGFIGGSPRGHHPVSGGVVSARA